MIALNALLVNFEKVPAFLVILYTVLLLFLANGADWNRRTVLAKRHMAAAC